MTRKNKSQKLMYHISCDFKCNLDGRKYKSNQKSSRNNCWCECEKLVKHNVCSKGYIWNPISCVCEINKYLKSIIADLVVLMKL